METHPGEHWDMFAMTVLKNHKTPLSTQVEEGHLISNFKGGMILNQKGDWGQNLPPKLVVTDGRDGSEKLPPVNEGSGERETGTKRSNPPEDSKAKRPKIMYLSPKVQSQMGRPKRNPN